jgi:hypothetical protein
MGDEEIAIARVEKRVSKQRDCMQAKRHSIVEVNTAKAQAERRLGPKDENEYDR